MKTDELIAKATDTMTVKRVYGEPHQENGVTFIPAASIRGGFGAGEGEGEGEGGEGSGSGQGGGGGVAARPVGAFRITGDSVTWVPAVDVTRVIMMSQLVGIVALFVIRSVLRRKRDQEWT